MFEVVEGTSAKEIDLFAGSVVKQYAKTGKSAFLRRVIRSLEALSMEKEGASSVVVTFAHEDVAAAEAFKRGVIEKGKKVLVTTVVDPSIMGGMIVEVGDIRIDASAQTHLEQLRACISI